MRVGFRAILICMIGFLIVGTVFGDSTVEEAFLEGLATILDTTKDYQVRIMSWAKLGNASEARIINLYALGTRKIRIDVIEGSRFGDDGAVAIIDGERVFARPGLRLFPIAVEYNKNNPRVQSIRGRSIDRAGLAAILSDIEAAVGVGDARISVVENGYEYRRTETRLGPNGDRIETGIVEYVLFAGDTFLPVMQVMFEGGEIVERAYWRHFYLDTGIPDEVFTTGYRSSRLRDRVFAPIASIPVSEDDRNLLDQVPTAWKFENQSR